MFLLIPSFLASAVVTDSIRFLAASACIAEGCAGICLRISSPCQAGVRHETGPSVGSDFRSRVWVAWCAYFDLPRLTTNLILCLPILKAGIPLTSIVPLDEILHLLASPMIFSTPSVSLNLSKHLSKMTCWTSFVTDVFLCHPLNSRPVRERVLHLLPRRRGETLPHTQIYTPLLTRLLRHRNVWRGHPNLNPDEED